MTKTLKAVETKKKSFAWILLALMNHLKIVSKLFKKLSKRMRLKMKSSRYLSKQEAVRQKTKFAFKTYLSQEEVRVNLNANIRKLRTTLALVEPTRIKFISLQAPAIVGRSMN